MEYKFHADDCVETKDGQIGYITTFIHSYDGESTILVKYKDGRTQGYKFHDEEPHRFFNRIGQYDFTKKNECKDDKIEPLQESWILEDAEGKGEYYFDSREVIKKINELVDVVNELKTDYEKHLRAHELTER